MEKIKIKCGQKWRSKIRGHCITVGHRLKGDWWKVHTPGKSGGHRMQETSFHFYELIQNETGDEDERLQYSTIR